MNKGIDSIRVAFLVLVFSLAGCSDNNGSASGPDKQSLKTPSTTANTVASDAEPPASAQNPFMTQAALSGAAEVELSAAAAERGASADVRRFAQMMIADHGKSNGELRALASEKNVTLPTGPDAEHRTKFESMRNLNGSELDKAYVEAMVADHQKAVDLFTKQAADNSDPNLKAFAAKNLPTLQKHLEMIKEIQVKLK